MNIFLDSDVMLDVSLGREHSAITAQLLQHAELGNLALHTSAIALANVQYIAAHARGKKRASIVVRDWLQRISIVPTTKTTLLQALEYDMNDWEDAVQLATAIAGACAYLVTRNVKDFTRLSPVKVVTPGQMLMMVG